MNEKFKLTAAAALAAAGLASSSSEEDSSSELDSCRTERESGERREFSERISTSSERETEAR